MFRLFTAYKEAFYGWIRRRTTPISIEEAEEKRILWSKIYAITSLAVFGVTAYRFYVNPSREKDPKKLVSSMTLSGNSIRFVTYKDFEKVEDITCTKEELKQLQESQPESSPELVIPSQNQNPKAS